MPSAADLQHLGASLAIGLLIGVERGWHQRELAAGARAAGVRTFALIGLLGGGAARVGLELGGPLVPAVAFLALAGLLVAAYAARVRGGGRPDATTEVAALVTFVLGCGPPLGFGLTAGAAAVVVAGLLSTKRRLHAVVAGLEERELFAALQLLALAFLLLPLLPAEGVGPWGALHLRAILALVLLIGGLSFLGYAVVRRVGARVGLALAAALGGLVSSTAVLLDFARRARAEPGLLPLLRSGVVGAGGTMYARVTGLVALVDPSLAGRVAPPLLAAALTCWLTATLGWRRAVPGPPTPRAPVSVRNPLALGLALKFALLLAGVSLLAAALTSWLGDRGAYVLAAVAGLGDVDAITLALSRQHAAGLAGAVAADAILIAAAVDTLLKVSLAFGLGGGAFGRGVALRLAGSLGAAGLVRSLWA